MSGREIENLLALMDVNLSSSDGLSRADVMRYLAEHQDNVLEELRTKGRITVPSSQGDVIVDLALLEAAVA